MATQGAVWRPRKPKPRGRSASSPFFPLASQDPNRAVSHVFVVHFLNRLQHVLRVAERNKPCAREEGHPRERGPSRLQTQLSDARRLPCKAMTKPTVTLGFSRPLVAHHSRLAETLELSEGGREHFICYFVAQVPAKHSAQTATPNQCAVLHSHARCAALSHPFPCIAARGLSTVSRPVVVLWPVVESGVAPDVPGRLAQVHLLLCIAARGHHSPERGSFLRSQRAHGLKAPPNSRPPRR